MLRNVFYTDLILTALAVMLAIFLVVGCQPKPCQCSTPAAASPHVTAPIGPELSQLLPYHCDIEYHFRGGFLDGQTYVERVFSDFARPRQYWAEAIRPTVFHYRAATFSQPDIVRDNLLRVEMTELKPGPPTGSPPPGAGKGLPRPRADPPST